MPTDVDERLRDILPWQPQLLGALRKAYEMGRNENDRLDTVIRLLTEIRDRLPEPKPPPLDPNVTFHPTGPPVTVGETVSNDQTWIQAISAIRKQRDMEIVNWLRRTVRYEMPPVTSWELVSDIAARIERGEVDQ